MVLGGLQHPVRILISSYPNCSIYHTILPESNGRFAIVLCRNCRIFGCLPRTVDQPPVSSKSLSNLKFPHEVRRSRIHPGTTFLPLLKELVAWSLIFSLDSWWMGLMEPSGTIKDDCIPSGAHGTTWVDCSHDKRGSSMYGFATAKVKPIYNWAVDVHQVLNNLHTCLGSMRTLFL